MHPLVERGKHAISRLLTGWRKRPAKVKYGVPFMVLLIGFLIWLPPKQQPSVAAGLYEPVVLATSVVSEVPHPSVPTDTAEEIVPLPTQVMDQHPADLIELVQIPHGGITMQIVGTDECYTRDPNRTDCVFVPPNPTP